MKNVLVALTALLAVIPAVAGSKNSEPNFDSVLCVSGRHSIAHACPIAADLVLTSAHVVDPRPFDADAALLSLRFQSVKGDTDGFLTPILASNEVDIAMLEPARPVAFYRRSETGPAPGDVLYFLGYDYKKPSVAFFPKTYSGKVVNIIAGMILIDSEAVEGSSGGCVLNASGEVVGVVTGRVGMDNQEGVAVFDAVWGDWIDRLLVKAAELKAIKKAAEQTAQ